jgi:hypothetical protein
MEAPPWSIGRWSKFKFCEDETEDDDDGGVTA